MSESVEPLLDCVDMAEMLNVPALWLKQQANDGKVPCLQVGRKALFSRGVTAIVVHEMASNRKVGDAI